MAHAGSVLTLQDGTKNSHCEKKVANITKGVTVKFLMTSSLHHYTFTAASDSEKIIQKSTVAAYLTLRSQLLSFLWHLANNRVNIKDTMHGVPGIQSQPRRLRVMLSACRAVAMLAGGFSSASNAK